MKRKSDGGRENLTWIGAIVVLLLVALIALVLVLICCVCGRRKRETTPPASPAPDVRVAFENHGKRTEVVVL